MIGPIKRAASAASFHLWHCHRMNITSEVLNQRPVSRRRVLFSSYQEFRGRNKPGHTFSQVSSRRARTLQTAAIPGGFAGLFTPQNQQRLPFSCAQRIFSMRISWPTLQAAHQQRGVGLQGRSSSRGGRAQQVDLTPYWRQRRPRTDLARSSPPCRARTGRGDPRCSKWAGT